VNSKYGDLDTLDKQFASVSQGRDISIYGKMSLAQKGMGYNMKEMK
jgi:hypothetical protein